MQYIYEATKGKKNVTTKGMTSNPIFIGLVEKLQNVFITKAQSWHSSQTRVFVL